MNIEDGSEEYCFSELSPLEHKPYGTSELIYTDVFHNVCSSLPRPSRQHQPAPGVSSKRSDIGLTIEPVTGVPTRLSHKYMHRTGPPPCCPTQSGCRRRSVRMPQGKGKVSHKPVNTQKQIRRKKLKHNASHQTRAQSVFTKSPRQRATSLSHSGRPPVTHSCKLALPSVPNNARLFYLDNYNHTLNPENAADDGAGRKCLQSGLHKSRICSRHRKFSPGSRVSKLAKNNGLPYNRSVDGKLNAALTANSDPCEKCYGPILAHGSNVYRPVASGLSSNKASARPADSEVASNDQLQSSHLDVATIEQRLLPPCWVIKRSMPKSRVPVARHSVQRHMLSSLNRELTTPAMINNSQTSGLSDKGQHGLMPSDYDKTLMSKRQRKQNYIDDNGSVMTADCLWKSDAPRSSQQFGNSANALLCTSPGEIHDNAWSSTAGRWRMTHGADDKQRITFRQCSAARKSHQNVPTFALCAVSSEQGHAAVSATTNVGQSNRESYIKRQFITNPSLHKHIDSKTFVSLGSCSSELKSLMRNTIIDLQKYKPEGSTDINNLPTSSEDLSLESRVGGKQLDSRSRPHSKRAGSQREKDHSNSRHLTDISVCLGQSITCNISRSEHAPGECKQQNHEILTGADTSVTTSQGLSWRQRPKTSDHTASGRLSSSMYQSHLESGQVGRTTNTVFFRESTRKTTLRDLQNQSYCPGDCRSYIDCNDLDNRRCYNHGMSRNGDKSELTHKNARRKRPLGYRRQCPNSNIICQETLRKLDTSEPLKLVPNACIIRAYNRDKRLNCETHTSVHCIETHGATLPPDKQTLNKALTLVKTKSGHKIINSRKRTVGGDDRIDQQIICGSMPDKSRQCSNVAQRSEGRCGDEEQKVADRGDELHSQTNSSQECTQPCLSCYERVNSDTSTSVSMHHLSDVSLMTNNSDECADLEKQMTFTSSRMTHSIEIQKDIRLNEDAPILSIHSAMDSLSFTRESEIVQGSPNDKPELSINGTGSREPDEQTALFSTDTATLSCDGIASVGTFSVSVSWDVCPSADVQKVVSSQTSSQTSLQTYWQTHKYPHHPNNLEHRIRDRNVSHGSAVKCGSKDILHLVPCTKFQQDNRCRKVYCQIRKRHTPDKRNCNIRHTSTYNYPLIDGEIVQAKKTNESYLRTWWNLPNRNPTHNYFPKERHQRHTGKIHLNSKKCALREYGLKKDSQMALYNSLSHTPRKSCRVSNSHILVLTTGPNYGVQNSLSSQSTSTGTSVYLAQLITDTSSLDRSDNSYRLQDALLINTDSLCRQSYQSSSSTSIATVCPSMTINTDTYCCPILYACGGNTYISREKKLAKIRCRSVEQVDDMPASSLNNTLKMNPLECQHTQTIDSWSNTITTISKESYLTGPGWDGSQLPVYCEFTGARSILARTRNIPKNSHPREGTLFAYTPLNPESGHHDMAMSMAHRHEHRCEPVWSTERYHIHHSCGTLQSSVSSISQHSCGTVQLSDDSNIQHSCGTVQPSDDSNIDHSCEALQLRYTCSPDHSCGTEQTKDSYNTDRDSETLQLSDCYSNQHRDPVLKASHQLLTHTRKPVSCCMSPPSIILNGEHVSYMQIVSKNGAFKGFRLSALDERPFPSILKKSHTKDAERKRVTGDSLLTVDRPPISSSVSQTVGFGVSLESESNGCEASFGCSSTSSHGGRAKSQTVEVDDNRKHVVCANPISQMDLTYQESAPETQDDLRKRKADINRQVCKHSHSKSPEVHARGDSHSSVISKSTQLTDFVETPKSRKEINEKKLRDQNPASIQAVHNMCTPDQTVKNKTETRQAHHLCKNSKIPRIFSQNTNISKPQRVKNQEREKTRKETSRKPVIGILMNRQEATSISKMYKTTARKESSNKPCKKVKTERSQCNNEIDQAAGVLDKDLNSKHCCPSSLRLHRHRNCRSTFQQTPQRVKDNHKQPPNNVRNQRWQNILQNKKCKPEVNNTASYKVENAQVRKNRVRWHRENIAEQCKTSSSKYQGPSKLANMQGVHPVLGSTARQRLIQQPSPKAHAPKSTLLAAKKARTKTMLSPRNLKALEEKTSNEYKKRIISQHESGKLKVPFSLTSKNCKVKAIFPSKTSEHANKSRIAHTCPYPGVDDTGKTIKKTADVLLPPCKKFRKDLFQREKITHLTTGKKSQPSAKQQKGNQKKYQSQLGLVPHPPRQQKTILSRNISKSMCHPGIATVSPTERSPPDLSHGLLYSKLRDNKRNVGSDTHCIKQSSLNSVMNYNDPKELTKISRHGSTCSPEKTLSHALSGSTKVGPNYVNKQRITGLTAHNPKVSSSDGRHDNSHQQSNVALSHQTRVCGAARNTKIPKTGFAVGEIESLASLSETSAAPLVGLRKGPDCYSPTARNTTRKFNRFPRNIHNSLSKKDRGVQTLQCFQQKNTCDNSKYLKYQRNRSCSQIVRKQEKTLVAEVSSKGQAYKNTTTKHVQIDKSRCDAHSPADMRATRKYGFGRLKHEAEMNNHSRSGVDSFQNIEILQSDPDVMCGYNLPESRGGSSFPRRFQKTANFGLNRDLVGKVLALSGNNSVVKADDHTDSQQIHSGHEFPEDGQYAPNNNRYGPAGVSTTVYCQPNSKLVTAVSAEVIKIPGRYRCDRSTSADEQGCTDDQFHLVKAACDTPSTDSSQQCSPASASEQPPVMQNPLKEIAVNNSTKNVRVHCMVNHLNAKNDYTTEDSSMFPNTTDDVSASAVFDNNSSVTARDCKHWADVQKNNIRNPYQQYTKQKAYQ